MIIRFANLAKTFAVLAILVGSTAAQEHVNVNPAAVRDRLNQSEAGASGAGVQTPPHAASSAKPSSENSPAQPQGKQSAHGASAERAVHRDPFGSLLNQKTGNGDPPENLPPGKPGLIISTLRIDGIVKAANGMIAIVMNPQQRVYFIREGDKLYDGSVEHITLEAISFHELGHDAFGRPNEHEVIKKLYPSPGEQQ